MDHDNDVENINQIIARLQDNGSDGGGGLPCNTLV